MGKLFNTLMNDVRFVEGLNACMNCGVCTAICPAAEFYNYDPRVIVDTVQMKDEQEIESLLKSETIWYCGECMSCKTRCPRGNTPGLIIMALRSLSQELGCFTQSEKGRQQLVLKRVIGHNILDHGYCIIPETVTPENHPEQGPMWEWVYNNVSAVMQRMGANFKGDGPGALRKIPQEALNELKEIFKVTGGEKHFEIIEKFSAEKAKEMKIDLNDGLDNDYIKHIYTASEVTHT